ncbi:MAG: hypothetical protein IT183_10535, partial [Acidobacteria bacterium]|nr:hypothetical protein [Acidobacteriota bacterium]
MPNAIMSSELPTCCHSSRSSSRSWDAAARPLFRALLIWGLSMPLVGAAICVVGREVRHSYRESSMKHAAYVLALILTLIATFASSATAEVIRITIVTRQPWNSGQPFGAVGPYEQIKGIAIGEIDPADPRNAVITDIDLAPRNAR